MAYMPSAPEPDDLTPADRELVSSPIASYSVSHVPRWVASAMREQGTPADHMLARRCAAALLSGNWDVVDEVLAGAEVTGVRALARAAIADLAVLAFESAQGNQDTATLYFEHLLQAQQLMDGEGQGD